MDYLEGKVLNQLIKQEKTMHWERAVLLFSQACDCLLYTSDAADERSSVDLGGRRIIKKKNMSCTDESFTSQNTTKHRAIRLV